MHERDSDEVVALDLFRNLRRTYRIPTEGQLEAVTRAYQDLIRVRMNEETKSKITHCMSRMSNFRYARSLNVTNLKHYSDPTLEQEGHNPEGLI